MWKGEIQLRFGPFHLLTIGSPSVTRALLHGIEESILESDLTNVLMQIAKRPLLVEPPSLVIKTITQELLRRQQQRPPQRWPLVAVILVVALMVNHTRIRVLHYQHPRLFNVVKLLPPTRSSLL